MNVNREELQEALTIVKPGLASREVIEQSTSFAFIEGYVVTYNDEISICHPIGGIDFEGAIKAEELYGLLSKLSKSEISIEVEEEELQIKCGRVSAGLRLEEEISLPVTIPSGKWKKISDPDSFSNFIELAARTCSGDMSQPKLTCVCVRDDVVIGSDGSRLIQCVGSESVSFLIPASGALELVKINPTHSLIQKSWIHFKNKKGSIFSCRRLDEDYISQDRVDEFLDLKKSSEIEFPAKIREMLGRVRQFAKRDYSYDEVIEVVIEKGKILLKARAEDTKSWIEESASIKTKESITFMITPILFDDILKMTRICVLDKSMTKVKFVTDDWEYVIMLAE